MEALLIGHLPSNMSADTKWGKMFMISLALHLLVFSTVLWVPKPMTTRKIQATVYEVDLVEMPRGKQERRTRAKVKAKTKTVKRLAPAKTSPAKKISRLKSKAKPVVIAKRAVETKTKKLSPPADPTQKHVDQALERIKANIEERRKDATDKTISRQEAQIQESRGKERSGRGENGITVHLYKLDIEDIIKRNWAYPAHEDKSLVAIVVLTVKQNGTILKAKMTQPSGNERFDQSVLKAIKRSDPLPPFPEGYRKTHEEIEINFNLSELENH